MTAYEQTAQKPDRECKQNGQPEKMKHMRGKRVQMTLINRADQYPMIGRKRSISAVQRKRFKRDIIVRAVLNGEVRI